MLIYFRYADPRGQLLGRYVVWLPRVGRLVAAIKRTKRRELLFPDASETHLVLFQQRSTAMEAFLFISPDRMRS